MIVVLVLALGFLWIAQILVTRRSRIDGIVSPIAVIAFSSIFYALTVPVELWFRRETLLGFTGFHMMPDVAERIVLATIVGFVALYVGYSACAPESRDADLARHAAGVRIAQTLMLLASGCGAILLATVFRANVLASSDYLSNVAQTALGSDSVAYFVINRWTYLSYGMFAFLSIANSPRPKRAILLLGPLLAWSVYSNDKDPLLVALLAASGLLYAQLVQRKNIPGLAVSLSMVLALLMMGIGAATFGTQRAGHSVTAETISASIGDGLFINVDPVGPGVVLARNLTQEGGAGSFAPTLKGTVSWLPSVVRPIDSTEDLAITFAKQYWPNWRPGYGYGYSPLAEGWRAAGYLGVVLVMFLAGVFFGVSRNIMLGSRSLSPASASIRVSAYYVVLGFLAFTFMRGTITSMISTAAIAFMLVILLSAVGRVSGHLSRNMEAIQKRPL